MQYRSAIVLLFIISSIFIFVQCINNEKNDKEKDDNEKTGSTAIFPVSKRSVNFKQFAGSSTCARCHKQIYEKHIHTSHYFTSKPAVEKYIKGSFAQGKNIYPFHPGLFVAMEKRDSGLYQVAYSKGIEKVARRFDIVMGSGAKGQTFLSWRGNNLNELPITYFTQTGQWCNSPGFPDKVVFIRPATSRCLECHSTFAKVISAPGVEPEEYDHDQILYGVDCEKCHGPAAEHVEYQTQNPKDTRGRYIINPASFTRQQILDLCALCHGGRLQKTTPSFEFTAGDKLNDFFVKNKPDSDTRNMDVHGNQYGLLSQSKCFKMSSLTCLTCHNSHENERGKITLFSERCMTCHNKEHGTFCKIDPSQVSSIKSNCIDCHMPKQSSMAITVLLPGQMFPTAALIHTHFITVYPDETKKFMDNEKESPHRNVAK